MKKIVIILMLLPLVNAFAEDVPFTVEKEVVRLNTNHTKECIEGHIYYVGVNRLAPKLDELGRPVKCGRVADKSCPKFWCTKLVNIRPYKKVNK